MGKPLFIIIALFIACFSLIASSWWQRHKKKKFKIKESHMTSWNGLITNLFEQYGVAAHPMDRLENIIRYGSQFLDLSYGVLFLHKDGELQVLAHTAHGYSRPLDFLPGQMVNRDHVFCGYLNATRPAVTIDFASLSDWRKHYAHHTLGLESYIGIFHEQSHGPSISLAFFDSIPRDHLFAKDEKEFLQHLGIWISSLLQNGSFEAEGFVKDEKVPKSRSIGA